MYTGPQVIFGEDSDKLREYLTGGKYFLCEVKNIQREPVTKNYWSMACLAIGAAYGDEYPDSILAVMQKVWWEDALDREIDHPIDLMPYIKDDNLIELVDDRLKSDVLKMIPYRFNATWNAVIGIMTPVKTRRS